MMKEETVSTVEEKAVPEEIEAIPKAEEEIKAVEATPGSDFNRDSWKPKTGVGKKIKSNEITHIDQILDSGLPIMEAEIIDALMPGLDSDLLLIGQSKGKFGGGQRRVFKQTQKKTMEGNKPHFSTVCVIGDHDGHVGLGSGRSKETVPAREKAIRNAKLHMIKLRRGCGSWECGCKQPHSIPFSVEGRCGSVRIILFPASRGTGLKVERECAKILRIAGIHDVVSATRGQTNTKVNLIEACFIALKKLIGTKVSSDQKERLSILEGSQEGNGPEAKHEMATTPGAKHG